MEQRVEGSHFEVKLSGIKLPADVESRVALEIRRVVMRELAGIDLKGDLRIAPGFVIGPSTQGFIAEVVRQTR